MKCRLVWGLIFVLWALRYVYMGAALLQLWLALPFMSGYNWIANLEHIGIAMMLYAAGCFVNSEWKRLSDVFMKAYPSENPWDE